MFVSDPAMTRYLLALPGIDINRKDTDVSKFFVLVARYSFLHMNL